MNCRGVNCWSCFRDRCNLEEFVKRSPMSGGEKLYSESYSKTWTEDRIYIILKNGERI